jgi:hypothetical protein
VFVSGIALNIDHVLDLFDRLLLLRIDADTQEERLFAPGLDNSGTWRASAFTRGASTPSTAPKARTA